MIRGGHHQKGAECRLFDGDGIARRQSAVIVQDRPRLTAVEHNGRLPRLTGAHGRDTCSDQLWPNLVDVLLRRIHGDNTSIHDPHLHAGYLEVARRAIARRREATA